MGLKQVFCVHWFDDGKPYDSEYSEGSIICTEQRTYTVAVQDRICSKCGRIESRRLGEPVYEGWQ